MLTQGKNIWKRIVVWTIGSILLIFLVLHFGSSIIATRLLRHTLAKGPVKEYIVDFESLHVNVLRGNIVVKGLILEPDNGTPDSLRNYPMYSVTVRKLKAINIGVFDLLSKKLLDADLVDADHVSLCLYRPARHDTIMSIPELDLAIDNLHAMLTDSTGFQPGSVRFDDLRASIVIDHLGIPGGMYELVKGGLRYSYADSLLYLDSIRLEPLFSKYEFGKKVGKQTDRIVFSVDRITVEALDLDQFLFNGDVFASMVTVDNPVFEVFRDKNLPLDMDHYPKLYNQQIREMGSSLSIDSILIRGGQVKYEEHAEGAAEAGYILIDGLDAVISNITNDSAAIADNEAIEIHASGRLNGAATAYLDISMPLNEPNQRFYFSGHLDEMDLTALNSITRDNARVEIVSGKARKTEFHAIANNDNSTGTMRMLYNNLELKVLKSNRSGYQQNFFLSGLANMVVIKQNPPKNKPERIGMMSYQRDKNKGFFNYIVKTIFSGAGAIALPGKSQLSNKEVSETSSENKKSQK